MRGRKRSLLLSSSQCWQTLPPDKSQSGTVLKDRTLCTATACAAGNHAIGDSFKIIQRGDAEARICGGAESTITPISIAGFAAMRALSTRNDDPEGASPPFGLDRDGFVVGEGSGIMILEELEHALVRGARIYAEIVGYGMTRSP